MDYDVTISIVDDALLNENFNSQMLVNMGVDVNQIRPGTKIKIDSCKNVTYETSNEITDSTRANISVYDSKKQRSIDEKSF
jgi:hypothetical protein